jgi:hypothetical protein
MTKIFALALVTLINIPVAYAAGQARAIKCDETTVNTVYVKHLVGARFVFPVKCDDVVFGAGGLYSVKYVKNDVHVSPVSGSSTTNMTAYYLGRTCTFKLVASSTRGDEIIIVKDSDTNKMKVKPE